MSTVSRSAEQRSLGVIECKHRQMENNLYPAAAAISAAVILTLMKREQLSLLKAPPTRAITL